MFRIKTALVASMSLILFVGLGLSQNAQPKKDKEKDPKDGKTPTIDQVLEADNFKEDLKVVRERGFKGEGPDLIGYFRERTLKQPDPKAIAELVSQLGDEHFPTREDAYTKLAGMGAAALAGLRDRENDANLELKKRVLDLKTRIDTKAEPTLQAAAARVLAKLKTEAGVL